MPNPSIRFFAALIQVIMHMLADINKSIFPSILYFVIYCLFLYGPTAHHQPQLDYQKIFHLFLKKSRTIQQKYSTNHQANNCTTTNRQSNYYNWSYNEDFFLKKVWKEQERKYKIDTNHFHTIPQVKNIKILACYSWHTILFKIFYLFLTRGIVWKRVKK